MLRKIFISIGVLLVVFAIFLGVTLYHYPKAQVVSASQQTAPDFTLRNASGQDFTLSSLHGQKVVLYFYRGYW
jgi:cytochrome oxidase Cu insertion factor (SCO1/SenC/PrrC family)